MGTTYSEEYRARIENLETATINGVLMPINCSSQERGDWRRFREGQKSDLRAKIENTTRPTTDATKALEDFDRHTRHRKDHPLTLDRRAELLRAVEAEKVRAELVESPHFGVIRDRIRTVARAIGDASVSEDLEFAIEKFSNGEITEYNICEILGDATGRHDARVAKELAAKEQVAKDLEQQAATARAAHGGHAIQAAAARDLVASVLPSTEQSPSGDA